MNDRRDLLDTLFLRQSGAIFDVTPDGRRLLFIEGGAPAQDPATTPVSFVVTLNWLDEIRAKLPKQAERRL